MDQSGHLELEAAEADQHQVDDEAGEGGGEEFTEDSKVIIPGPACQHQTLEPDWTHIVLTLPGHGLEPGQLIADMVSDVRNKLLLTTRTFECTRSPNT